jgi:lipid-A-disaccharide synthase-like uncharacterized protein
MLIGFIGQGLFFSRFLVQWIESERQGRSTIPRAFWWFSLAGGLVTFVYAAGRHDIPIALGQGIGLVVYIRNLMLIRGAKPDLAD